MSRKMCLLAVVLVAAAIGLTPAANAQCSAAQPNCVHYVGVGSSAMWQGFALAAFNDLVIGENLATTLCPAGDTCQTAHWQLSNGGNCVDTRNAKITTNQTNNLWVVWVEDVTAGSPDEGVLSLWAYLTVDSTVGNRCFLARTAGGVPDLLTVNGTVPIAPTDPSPNIAGTLWAAIPTCSWNGGPVAPGNDCDLDAAAYGALAQPGGIAFTAGMTDIRPEDALYATRRSNGDASGCGTGYSTDEFTSQDGSCYYGFALGYDLAAAGGNGLGNGVGGGITDLGGTAAQPVAFALPGGTDPFTGGGVPATIKIFPVGESPIVFVANRENTTTGLGQIIGNYVAGQGNCYNAGLTDCQPQNTGQPAGYTSDGSYYVRNVWDQHPWPMVNNVYPTLGGNATLSAGSPTSYDPSGNGFCPAGTNGECQLSRRPLAALFAGNDCEGDNFAFSWPLAPGVTQGLRAQIPNREAFPVTLFLREPLSGTYNTTEWTVIRRMGTPGGSMGTSLYADSPSAGLNPYPAGTTFEREVYLNQELGIDPSNVTPVAAPQSGTYNPLNLTCPADQPEGAYSVYHEGGRVRGVGTSHVISGKSFTTLAACFPGGVGGAGNTCVPGVENLEDSIAYTFFSFGNVSKVSASKNWGYLMVDAIDPLFDNYENATNNGGITLANSTHFPAPWGDGAGSFPGFSGNTEGEPACEGTGSRSTGCDFPLAYPASQEPGQPANNTTNYASAFVGPTGFGVLPACGGAGQPACNAAAIWHTPVFGTDDSVNCPANFPCTYPHLRDGSYPAWSELRMMCDTASGIACNLTGPGGDPYGAEALVQALQSDIHNSHTGGVPDLLPMQDASTVAPYGDAYFIRDHFAYAAMDDGDIADGGGPWPTCANLTSHLSVNSAAGLGLEKTVTYTCNGGVPVNGPPTSECGGDVGGFVRSVETSTNYTPFYSPNGAYASTCAEKGIVGDLQ